MTALNLLSQETSTKAEIPLKNISEAAARRKLSKFCGVTVLIVVATITFLEIFCRFLLFLGKPALTSNPQYHAKYLVAKTVTPWADNIVLCGDSLVKQGLYPELIAAKLQRVNPHLRVVNLAVNGGSQQDAIAYLDYLRDFRCTKPRLVVFDFEVSYTGYEFQPEPGPNATKLNGPPGYLFERAMRRDLSLEKAICFFPSDVSQMVRQRGSIKHFLIDFLSLIPNSPLCEQRSTVELCNVNDGGTTYCGTSPDYNLTLLRDIAQRDSQINRNWFGSPKQGNFHYNPEVYAPIISYCQRNEIPLMLVWLPHQNYLYDRKWYSAPYTQEWFKAAFEDYSRRLFVFPCYLNNLPEDPAYYTDYRHLSAYGCIKVTEMLANFIAQPRYRTLITHHDDPSHRSPE